MSRLPTDYLHVSTMNRILNDGHEVDGWFDLEMQQHPIVIAYRRRLASVSSTNMTNSTNTTNGPAQVLKRPIVQLSFTTAQKWSFFTPDKLNAIGALFASFFSVDPTMVDVTKTFTSAGVGNKVQVWNV